MEAEDANERVEYRPAWNRNVVGLVARTNPEPGETELVKFRCEVCGQRGAVQCHSGAYRQHVDRFARQHVHTDPFKR